jgi:hypothetical protein
MTSEARTTQVEITLSWGSTVVSKVSLCPPRAVHVGDDACTVPAEQLGIPQLPLLTLIDGEPCLVMWPGARGTVALPGEVARPLDHVVVESAARPWPGHPDLLTLPLPAGSTAAIVLSRPGPQSVYRVASGDDRVAVHVAVTRVPRRSLHRSIALRYAAIAALSISAIAHVSVFAAAHESRPALTALEEEPPRQPEAFRLLGLVVDPTAEHEPDEWDHVRAPMDITQEDMPYYASDPSLLYGPGTWWGATTDLRASGVVDGLYRYPTVPPELSGCFARPPREPGWPLPPPVRVTRYAGEPPQMLRGRARRPTAAGDLYGPLVVDDDEPLSEYYVPSPWLREARPRRPRLAFEARAVEILEGSLAQAEPAFAWCYQQALQGNPALSGRVAMRVAAQDGRGGVDAEGTGIDDPELRCCLANAQRLWAPRVRGDAEVRYAIDFERGS